MDLVKKLEEMAARIRQYVGNADRPFRTIEEIALRSAALHEEAIAALRVGGEPVGWATDNGEGGYIFFADNPSEYLVPGKTAFPVYRAPAPVAVTDEMVERACNAFWGPLGLAPLTDQAKAQERRRMLIALSAALAGEVG